MLARCPSRNAGANRAPTGRAAAVLAATLVLSAAACTGGDRSNRGASTTSMPAGVVASGRFSVTEGPQLADLPVGAWTALPPSPVGKWEEVVRFALWDGSGWIESGSHVPGPDGKPDLSRRTAYFSLAEQRYLELPPLPVQAGLGASPTGVRVGNRLVLVGYDCPATPMYSMQGAEYCAPEGGSSAKVVLVYDLAKGTWKRLAVPEWMRDFQLGSPSVVGTARGKIVLASQRTSPTLAELDPASGAWRQIGKGLEPNPDLSLKFCMIDREVVALQAPFGIVARIVIGPLTVSRLTDGQWSEVVLPEGLVGQVRCGRRGIYLWRTSAYDSYDSTLFFFDPTSGSETELMPFGRVPNDGLPVSGDVMVLRPGSLSDQAVMDSVNVATPFKVVPLNTGPIRFVSVVGDVLVDESTPRIFRMGANADTGA